mmetsp:Transcript_53800/g.172477  ORF Transcript_53800/g.172477 Transcript_53800/m.172477 type:complete len:432 (+) Transcript_53800:70-1365(+)
MGAEDPQKLQERSPLLRPPAPEITSFQVGILCFAIFLKGGLFGAYLPFSSLWLSRKGYAASDLGLVAFVDSICSTLLPAIGGCLDKLRSHNIGFVLLLLMLTALKLAYLAVANNFVAIVLLTALTAPLLRASNSVLDAMALYAFADRGHFSRVRLVGDLGYGLLALLVGFAMAAMGSEDAIFLVFASICGTLAIVWAMASPWMRSIRPDSAHMNNREFCIQLRLLRDTFLGAFTRPLLVLCLLGGALGLVVTFEFVLLDKMMGSSVLLGVCKLTGTIAAIPVWWFMPPVMDRIGLRNVQLITLGASAVRLLILGLIRSPRQALLSEACSGVGGFAAAYSSIMVFTGRAINEDMKATAQTIIATALGIGTGVGPVLGSVLVEDYGVQGMFLWTAAFLAAVTLGLGFYDLMSWLVLGTYRSHEDACKISPGLV